MPFFRKKVIDRYVAEWFIMKASKEMRQMIMEKKQYYTAGKFAKMAGITLRALRYYDEVDLLKPSARGENGYRLYHESDMITLQRIIALRYLRFSVEEIREELNREDGQDLMKALVHQKEVFIKEQEHLKKIVNSIEGLEKEKAVTWEDMTHLIQLIKSDTLIRDYFNEVRQHEIASDLGRKHRNHSQAWSSFMFQHINVQKGEKVLDLDVSSNVRWAEYSELLPYCKLTQTAMSERILQSVKQKMKEATWPEHPEFEYMHLSEQEYSLPEEQYDVIVCDHLFLRGLQMEKMLESCQKALKPGGRILVSAIGYNHMKELIELVKNLDPRIHFYNMDSLYYFGKENGSKMLAKYFEDIQWKPYDDEIVTDDVDLLTEYVWTTYSNVQEIMSGKKNTLKRHIAREVKKKGTLRIQEEAGVFLAIKVGKQK